MKNLVYILLFSIISISGYGKIKVVKQGGKKCGTTVCYDYVQDVIHNNGDRNITCRNKGNEKCPSYGVVTIGDEIIRLEDILADVESNILNGITSGSMDILSSNDNVVAICTFNGALNDEGIVEYVLVIDEV